VSEGLDRVLRLRDARATWQLLRGGDLRARVRATRQGQVALRLHLIGAALETGLLDALAERAATAADLAGATGASDVDLLEAFLRVMAAAGLVGQDDGGLWRLRKEGRVVLDDDLVRASYEAFAGFHTGLYRELPPLLAGGAARRDIIDKGGVIARLSAAFEPFVEEVLLAAVTARAPRRVLDIGCGSALQLATMLEGAPAASGVGVESDPAAAGLAVCTLARRGLADRASVVGADIEEAVRADHPDLVEPFDFALMANMIYYVPVAERVPLLRLVAGLLAPGGVLLVVTTAATPQLVSRHFDLLLRAQEGRMELPGADALVRHLTEAGLRPGTPEWIAPGSPLVAVSATCRPEPQRRRPEVLS
jgi:SAM-dependent methyltransferase